MQMFNGWRAFPSNPYKKPKILKATWGPLDVTKRV